MRDQQRELRSSRKETEQKVMSIILPREIVKDDEKNKAKKKRELKEDNSIVERKRTVMWKRM